MGQVQQYFLLGRLVVCMLLNGNKRNVPVIMMKNVSLTAWPVNI